MDIRGTLELLSRAAELVRYHLPPEVRPDPVVAGFVLMLAGLVLAVWGARLLKALLVLLFAGAGVGIGIQVARYFKTDDLLGLLIGGLLLGFLGYALYRWWVAVVAGAVAVVIAAFVLAPAMLPDLPDEAAAFWDERHQVGSDDYSAVLRDAETAEPEPSEALLEVLNDFRAHLWLRHGDQLRKLGVLLAAAWLVGLIVGLMMPRFTAIAGTSLIGVAVLSAGLGVLAVTYRPELWARLMTGGPWTAGGLAGLVLVFALYQARRRPSGPAVPAPPPAA